jgi:hypothetical protein
MPELVVVLLLLAGPLPPQTTSLAQSAHAQLSLNGTQTPLLSQLLHAGAPRQSLQAHASSTVHAGFSVSHSQLPSWSQGSGAQMLTL